MCNTFAPNEFLRKSLPAEHHHLRRARTEQRYRRECRDTWRSEEAGKGSGVNAEQALSAEAAARTVEKQNARLAQLWCFINQDNFTAQKISEISELCELLKMELNSVTNID